MHFVILSCNVQVAMDDCNGPVMDHLSFTDCLIMRPRSHPFWNIYIQCSSWWWESTIYGHMSNMLSKKNKGPDAKNPPLKQTCDKRKRKRMWTSGGLQVQKMGIVGETRGKVAGMELRWWHGMGNRTKWDNLNLIDTPWRHCGRSWGAYELGPQAGHSIGFLCTTCNGGVFILRVIYLQGTN